VPVDKTNAAAVLEWMESSKGGEARIVNQADAMSSGPLGIPFLSPTLTWATTGGAKIGHFNRWYGPEGSGKSLSNWGLAYNAQNYPAIMTERYEREIKFWEKKGPFFKVKAKRLQTRLDLILKKFPDGMSVMIFDTEQRADASFAVRMGVDMKKENCVIIEQNVIEYIVDEIREATGSYHVFIVDSVSNGQSLMQAGLVPGEEDRASAAKAWTRLRQVRNKWDRTENTLILVDQLRAAGIGGRGSTKPVPSQARFLKHNISLDIEFDRGTKLYLNDKLLLVNDKDKGSNDFKAMGTDGKSVAGLEMRAHVEKNSTGKPFRDAVMRFRFDVTKPSTGELVQGIGFDESFELLKIAEYYHVVDAGGGGMFYLLDDNFEKIKGKSWKGEWNAIRAIADDEELRERLITRIQIDT
jgi:RecA/RadA recombinase